MSVPEANALSPAPVRIKALSAGLPFASWQISARRSYIWNVNALRACGRLKVITANSVAHLEQDIVGLFRHDASLSPGEW